jgi:hypothetical protein
MESTPLKSPLSSKGMRTPEKQGDAAEDPEELARIIKLRETYAYFKQIQDEMELELDDEVPKPKPKKSTAVWSNLKSAGRMGAFTASATASSTRKKTPGFGGSVLQLMQDPNRKSKFAGSSVGGMKTPSGKSATKAEQEGEGVENAEEAKEEAPPAISIEEEDQELDNYWSKVELDFPKSDPLQEFIPPNPPTYEEEYAQESKDNKVVLGKIPKEKVREQKDVLKTKLYEERAKTIEVIKSKERDVIWREHLAMERVKQMEDESREKMANERVKLAKVRIDRERRMAREFRRAREALETSVQRQGAVLGEVFGELDAHSQRSMARKMYVKSTLLPQPVEFRVHVLRAVKNKLPRGAYTLMVTQYDCLGGRALSWSTIGSHSIGEGFPATTRAVKHAGRYFDKSIKFEDSCFALCPAKKDCKPSFVFIFELFELKSRTNSHDKVVAWTAMPMCTDGMTIAQGKMKLPMLRGRHTPNESLFRRMEESIAADLDSWLCNLYVEIRAFSISELGEQAREVMKLNRFVNFDYLNKWLDLQNGAGKYSKTFGSFGRKADAESKVRAALDASNPGVGPDGATGSGEEAPDQKGGEEGDEEDEEDELADMEVHLDRGLLRLTGAKAEDIHVSRVTRKESKFSSKGTMYSAAGDKEAHRARLKSDINLLDTSAKSFRDFEDGFGEFSAKVRRAQEQSSSSLMWAWQQLDKMWVERVMGETYHPSQSSPGRRSRRQILASRRMLRSKDQSRRVRDVLMSNKGKYDDHGGGDFGSSRVVEVRGEADMPFEGELRRKPGGSSSLDLRNQLFTEDAMDDVDLYSKGGGDGPAEEENDEEAGGMSASSKKYYGTTVSDADRAAAKERDNNFDMPLPFVDDLDSDGFSVDEDEKNNKAEIDSVSSSRKMEVIDAVIVDPRKKQLQQEHARKLEQKARDAEDELVSTEVMERGLESGAVQGAGGGISIAHDLHYEQSGKLVGVETVDGKSERYFASSGLNKPVLRRLQADGPRVDAEGVPDPADTAEKGKEDLAWLSKLQPSRSNDGPAVKWNVLEDQRDFDLYNMSLQAQSAAMRLTAGGVVSSKLRLLTHTVLGDVAVYKWGSFEFYVTLFCVIFSLWLRIWLHYLGEYMYLSALGVPIYDFAYMALQIQFKYMSSGLTFGSEVCVIFMGLLFVILVFCTFAELERLFHRYGGIAPEGLSKFISCFGLNMVLGPFVTLFIDLCYSNYDCNNQSTACRADYTSTDCDCFNGDFAKLWERTRSDEGSGISGFLITIIVYVAFTGISAFFFYEYLVYLHKDGMVLDLWRRISADDTEFFIPDDFEISLAELKVICAKSAAWTGPDGSKRKLSVSVHEERDPEDETFVLETKLFTIFEISFDGQKKKVWRQFLAEPDGTISEVYDRVGANEKDQALPSPDFNFTHPTAVRRTRTGIFKGLERA